jgi:hypothetical protein
MQIVHDEQTAAVMRFLRAPRSTAAGRKRKRLWTLGVDGVSQNDRRPFDVPALAVNLVLELSLRPAAAIHPIILPFCLNAPLRRLQAFAEKKG